MENVEVRRTLTPARRRPYACVVIAEKIPALAQLSVQEKLLLASELWDEVTARADEIPIPQHILDELDRRMEEYRRDPSAGSPWPEVKQRIQASLA